MGEKANGNDPNPKRHTVPKNPRPTSQSGPSLTWPPLSMLQHLSRASVRANASLVASRKISAVRLASTQTLDTSTEKPKALLTAFIRTWRPPTGVPEALLILAEIEKKYGKIRESHFLKVCDFAHTWSECPAEYEYTGLRNVAEVSNVGLHCI